MRTRVVVPGLLVVAIIVGGGWHLLGLTAESSPALPRDGFHGKALDGRWSFDDPDGDDAISLTARPGWLQIQVGGPGEDVWSTGRGGAPFLRTSVERADVDFELETHVDLATSNGGYPVLNALGGLLVCDPGNPDDTAPFELTLGLQHDFATGTEVLLQSPGKTFRSASPGSNAAYLRLERRAGSGVWSALYKVNRDDPWIPLAAIRDADLPGGGIAGSPEVGLLAKTWDPKVGGPANIDFAFFGRPGKGEPDGPPAVSVGEDEAPTRGDIDISTLRTFCVSGKERGVLDGYREAELLRQMGKGCLTHMWFGGDWPGYEKTRIRVYVDGEKEPSIDMELGLGHGYGFGDPTAPWGSAKLGKTGHPSGVYNCYPIPFGRGVRVTAQRDETSPDGAPFWWIVRGTENLPVMFAGVRLPADARLELHKLEQHVAKPFEEFSLCDVKGAGVIYQVTIAADGLRDSGDWRDLSYLEAIVRAHVGAARPLQLSSGLEDYFLGTYYFNRGRYANGTAGLTHLDKKRNTFSAYRFHDDDPVFFHNGLRLTCRCGEEIGGRKLHDPPETEFTTYTWIYRW